MLHASEDRAGSLDQQIDLSLLLPPPDSAAYSHVSAFDHARRRTLMQVPRPDGARPLLLRHDSLGGVPLLTVVCPLPAGARPLLLRDDAARLRLRECDHRRLLLHLRLRLVRRLPGASLMGLDPLPTCRAPWGSIPRHDPSPTAASLGLDHLPTAASLGRPTIPSPPSMIANKRSKADIRPPWGGTFDEHRRPHAPTHSRR